MFWPGTASCEDRCQRLLDGADRSDSVCLAARDEHLLKGGSFYNIARDLRVANRLSAPPDLRHRDIGFRCASTDWPGR